MIIRVALIAIIVVLIMLFLFYKYAEWAMGIHVVRSIATAQLQSMNTFQQNIMAKSMDDELHPSYLPPAWVVDAYKPTKFWILFYNAKYL